MLDKWFNVREATAVGSALAEQFVPVSPERTRRSASRQQLERLLQRVDREARPLKLNVFTRAKLANSFRWRLIEAGVDKETVAELTGVLLRRLSARSKAVDGEPAGPIRSGSAPRQITDATRPFLRSRASRRGQSL